MTYFAHTLYQGHHYLKTWPRQASLNAVFPENRVIEATLFAKKYAPPIAIGSVIYHFTWGNPVFLTQMITFVLFTLSLPMQGLYWLGRRSETPLPPNLIHWYHELQIKIADTGKKPVTKRAQPRYQELAEILTQAFECLTSQQFSPDVNHKDLENDV